MDANLGTLMLHPYQATHIYPFYKYLKTNKENKKPGFKENLVPSTHRANVEEVCQQISNALTLIFKQNRRKIRYDSREMFYLNL